ncbi:MAG: von Willebrand factor type A domain-containing protein [Planctomycetota bacterium]
MSERELDQGQHERRCAYVFGELQGEERVAFERELAASSELRAEKARLEATVALVKTAVPEERLSPVQKSDLVASARRSRFRVLGRRPLELLVAAAVLVVGAAAALRFVPARRSFDVLDVRDGAAVARAPELEKKRKEITVETPAEPRSEVEAEMTYEEFLALESLPSSEPVPSVASATTTTKELRDSLGRLAESDSNVVVAKLEDAEKALAFDGAKDGTLFKGSSTESTEAMDELRIASPGEYGVPDEDLFQELTAGASAPGAPAAATPGSAASAVSPDLDAFRLELGVLAGEGGPGSLPATGENVTTGSEGWFLGQGEKKAGDDASRPVLNLLPDGSMINKRRQLRDPSYVDLAEVERYLKDRARLHGERGVAPTAEELARMADEVLAGFRPKAGESPRDMFFRWFGDAPFVLAGEERVSTFAADVDTASYALARAYLNRGELPPREAVRTEEFVNYFKADQPAPSDGQPFALSLELAPSLFAADPRTEILRVTLRARDVADFERKPVALTLVIDNSGSMEEGGRLELVKRALALLLRELRAGDSVGVVQFHSDASVVTPMIPATRRGELESLIGAIPINGGTNVEAGLRLGFEQALAALVPGAVNRVVLCSDGVGNIGETNAKALLALVEEARAKGIYLNTVGVGMGNHNDAFLEELADKGDGVCNYVDSDTEAKRVFVDGLASAFQPVARDVKVQVEFDPAQVERWRLLGYENRALRTQDFKNDAIDAGEVNAGHQISALYELVRNPGSGPVATARVRYKPPFALDAGRTDERAAAENEVARELERVVRASDVLSGFAAGSPGFRRAVLVAQLAEVLRQSVHARNDSFARLLQEAKTLESTLGDPDFTEFTALLAKANPLLDARAKEETPRLQELSDELARLRYEEALAARQRELAAEAGEAAGDAADEAGSQRTREIERVEALLRAELERLLAPDAPRVR